MKTREEALNYGLSFPNTYMEMPFHDPNWQLVRVKGSKKAFLWTYEKDGCLHLNVKTDPAWRDFWRSTFSSVIPAYHQNKDHWNTIILDGSIPDEDIRRMIAESYDLVTDSPTKRIYEAVKRFRKAASPPTVRLPPWPENRRWPGPWAMPCTRTRIPTISPATAWSIPKGNSPVPLPSAVPTNRPTDSGPTASRSPAIK